MKFVLTFITVITFYLEEVLLIEEIDDEDILNILLADNKYDSGINLNSKVKARNAKDLPLCNEDQLMMYLAEIQAINPERIINLSTLEDLTNLCNKVFASLNRMDNYLKTCEPPQQKDLYIQLIKGVNSLYQKLCSNGSFKTKFQQYYDCFHDLHNDFEDCFGPADWTEYENDSKVCKAYHDITDCYYTKTAKLCGKEAADVMKELILTVINSILVTKCEEVKINPRIDEIMPEKITKSLSNMVLSSTFPIMLLCTGCFTIVLS